MFKNLRKGTSLVLATAMFLWCFGGIGASAAGEELIEVGYKFIDLGSYFNADVIGKPGDVVNTSTWFAGRTDGKQESGKNGTALYNEDESGIYTKETNGHGYSASEKTNISFKIDKNGLAGGVNDCIYLSGDGKGTTATAPNAYKEVTIKTSGLPLSKLYFTAMAYGSSEVKVVATIHYKDGTSELQYKKDISSGELTRKYLKLTSNSRVHLLENDDTFDVIGFWWGSKDNGNGNNLIPNSNNVLEAGTTDNRAMAFYELDVNTTKVPESVTLSMKYDSSVNVQSYNDAAIFSMTEILNITNEEMQAFLAAIDTNAIAADFSEENVSKLETALLYIDELVSRGANADNYAEILALKTKYERYLQIKAAQKNVNYIDMRPFFNADIFGQVGEEINVDTWFGGQYKSALNEGNTATMYKSGIPYDKFFSSDLIESYDSGYMKIKNNGRLQSGFVTDINAEINTISIPLFFDESTLQGGVEDAIYLRGAQNNAYTYGITDVTIPLSGLNSERVYFAALAYSLTNYNTPVILNYADGTSVESKLAITNSTDVNRADASNVIAFWYCTRGENSTYTMSPVYDETKEAYVLENTTDLNNSRMGIYTVAADKTKRLESITIGQPLYQNDVAIFAMTEMLSTTVEEMYKGIEELDTVIKNADYIITSEQKNLIYTARRYADELVARGLEVESKYTYIDDYITQLEAMDEIYADLSGRVNTDLIVAVGDAKDANATYVRDVPLYSSAQIPSDGIIVAEGSADTLGENGRTFKLSGNYKNVGNDAVLISANDLGETFELSGEVLSQISVITDSATGGNTPLKLNAKITYTDGTYEEIEYDGRFMADSSSLHRSYAHIGGFGRVTFNSETGKFESVSGNATVMYPAVIPVAQKPVSQILLQPDSSDYQLLAITEVPSTNTELVDCMLKAMDLYDDAAETWKNSDDDANTVLEGYYAYMELRSRKASVLADDADAEYFAGMRADAEEVLGIAAVIKKPVFNVSVTTTDTAATANVTMTNETEYDQKYILVIAAYDANNKLLKLNILKDQSLKAGANGTMNSISMDLVDGATKYKGLIWEDLINLVPLRYGEWNSVK